MNAQHYDNKKLAEKRVEKCTQQELAAALGISEMTVNRAEKGKQVSYELLLKMCEHIGLDIREILFEKAASAS